MHSITNKFIVTRIVSLPENNPDIEAFIETELENCLQRGLLTIGGLTLILEIQDILSKGSNGMFLWVALQIKSLCSQKTDHVIREALADLPKDLSGTFARILQKSGTDPSLQTKTLQLVLAASRPLTTDELREVLSVMPGDADWDSSKLLHNVYAALACCGCLLAVDEEVLTVRVVHHSVKQYLLVGRDCADWTYFSLKDAQRVTADIIVTYLCYGVFGTELSKINARPVMAQPILFKIVQSTAGSSSNSSGFAIKLLKLRKQSDFDLTKAITDIKVSSPSEKENSFSFYQYANTHFYENILFVSGKEAAIFRLASKLIHLRASTLHIETEKLWSVCERAVENENERILGLLLQVNEIDINSIAGWRQETILITAASRAENAMVEVLLGLDKIDVNARAWGDPTAIMRAISNRHRSVAGMVLENGKANINATNDDRFTALMFATISGDEELVKQILNTGTVEINAQNSRGVTALIIAAERGLTGIVGMVLKSGKANVNIRNDMGLTALSSSASVEHRSIVEMLIKTGNADVTATNEDGFTVLTKLASMGYEDAVQMILDSGNVEVNKKDKFGRTALMHAVNEGQKGVVQILVTKGAADVNAVDYSGKTALERALERNFQDIVDLLRLHGASDS